MGPFRGSRPCRSRPSAGSATSTGPPRCKRSRPAAVEREIALELALSNYLAFQNFKIGLQHRPSARRSSRRRPTATSCRPRSCRRPRSPRTSPASLARSPVMTDPQPAPTAPPPPTPERPRGRLGRHHQCAAASPDAKCRDPRRAERRHRRPEASGAAGGRRQAAARPARLAERRQVAGAARRVHHQTSWRSGPLQPAVVSA